MPPKSTPIDQVAIRMYRLGTGDCFTIKFLKRGKTTFTMMIDCGCWSGSKEKVRPFLEELKNDVEGHVDVLVVTHEHKDHVYGFEHGEDLFTDADFQVDQTWMSWTENDADDTVADWKRDHGEKKKAIAAAAIKLTGVVESSAFSDQLVGARDEEGLRSRRSGFAEVLHGFAELHGMHFSASKEYVDGLAGMAIVKDKIAGGNISFLSPGKVIKDLPGLEGVRIFVLGPPAQFDFAKREEGPAGEAYEHNKDLEDTDAFAAAINTRDGSDVSKLIPFDDCYISSDPNDQQAYNAATDTWRRVDHDWLFSAGSLALRMSSRTNNLSLVLAIEFIDSGKVLLFPGDAEFGSWESWHEVDWEAEVKGLTTEMLLNRVVFYKVAHHLSHHGTARGIGLDMMTSPELVAMATLDYSVIPPGWKSTMPNVALIKDLLEKTKGRTMIMNTENLLFDRKGDKALEPKIQQYRKRMNDDERKLFENNLDEHDLYIGFTIDV